MNTFLILVMVGSLQVTSPTQQAPLLRPQDTINGAIQVSQSGAVLPEKEVGAGTGRVNVGGVVSLILTVYDYDPAELDKCNLSGIYLGYLG